MPRSTAGRPSMRNSHCQPRSPSQPSSASSPAETGAPTIIAIGAAVMKSAFARARSVAGIQYVRYSTTPGKKPASARPSSTARHVEARRIGDEHRPHRHETPHDHDSRDPAPGPDALEDQVARDLEQEITEEEESRAEAVRPVAQTQIFLKICGREADVDAVDVRDDVADEDEWNEPPDDAVDGRRHRSPGTLP